ncbi:MAG: hypothetical protein IPP79_17705 [Chitinophagaceae bacterium]|nr:hypothetical protein [Chitinophagaceae bacterium]
MGFLFVLSRIKGFKELQDEQQLGLIGFIGLDGILFVLNRIKGFKEIQDEDSNWD